MDHRVITLKQKKQYEQRTKEWFEVRKGLVSASNASCLLKNTEKNCRRYVELFGLDDKFINNTCSNPYSSREEFLLGKCGKGEGFTNNAATHHGNKYEPIACEIYSIMKKVNVLEFGLLIHDELPWLSASPDGITEKGVMVEIKCPYRRYINGIVPFYYYIQVQIQLEVCDLEECHFIEFKFVECLTEEEFLKDSECLYESAFIKVEDRENINIPCLMEEEKFIYPFPKNKETMNNKEKTIEWVDKVISESEKEDNKLGIKNRVYIPVYYRLVKFCNTIIKRDREWFENVKDDLKKGHEDIIYFQTNPDKIEDLYSKKKKTRVDTCLLDSTDEE